LRATLWFALLAAVATSPALFGDRSLGPESALDIDALYANGAAAPYPGLSDNSRLHLDLPRDLAIARGLRRGRVDLWNPLVACGMPLWTEGGAPFLPLKIPYYLAPSRRTYDIATALRLVVAGLGAYLLARRRRLEMVPAVAAGSLFELSGAMFVTLPFGTAAPISLLPWVLLGVEAIARRRDLRAAAATGFSLGLVASSGHPMLAVLVFTACGAAVAGHALAAWRQPRTVLAITSLACLALVLGLAIAAPSLLSLLEAMRIGRAYKENSIYTLLSRNALDGQWRSLPIAVFAPALLVEMRHLLPAGYPHIVAPVVGTLGLVLALVGVYARGLDSALSVVAVVGVGMTVAPTGLAWIRQLPLIRYVYATYGWSLVALPLTQAAGRGVEVLSTSRGRHLILAALGVALLGTVSLLFVKDHVVGSALFDLPVRGAMLSTLTNGARWRLLLPLAFVVPAVTLVIVTPGNAGRWRATAVAALAVVELLATLWPAAWYEDSKVLAASPSSSVRFLQRRLDPRRDRMLAVPIQVGHPATPALFGLPDFRGLANIPIERYVRYLDVIAHPANWLFDQHTGTVMRSPLLDLAAVRYVVTVNPWAAPQMLEDDYRVRMVHFDRPLVIYENTAALPRVRIAHEAIAVRDMNDAEASLRRTVADGGHAVPRPLLVEASTDGRAPPIPSGGPPPTTNERARIVDDGDPDRLVLDANLQKPGYVVLADTFHPGWTASIDGTPTPVHPADLLFRAVFVPAGRHTIVYRYAPASFTIGVALAGLGLAACGLLAHARWAVDT